jgi:hypothetical protein
VAASKEVDCHSHLISLFLASFRRARAHDLAECIALIYSRDEDPSAYIAPPSALLHASSHSSPAVSCRTSCGELLSALICAAFPSLPIAAPPNQVGWLLPLPPLLPLKDATLLAAESSVQPLCPRLELQFSKSAATASAASRPASNSSSAAAASVALLDHLWNWNGQMSVKYFPPVWVPTANAANGIADEAITVVSESRDDDGEWALNTRAAQSARVAQLRTRLLHVAQRSPMVGPVRFRALASRHVENSLLKRQMIGASELGHMVDHARRVDGGADGIETAAVLASLVWQPLEARLFRGVSIRDDSVKFSRVLDHSLILAFQQCTASVVFPSFSRQTISRSTRRLASCARPCKNHWRAHFRPPNSLNSSCSLCARARLRRRLARASTTAWTSALPRPRPRRRPRRRRRRPCASS